MRNNSDDDLRAQDTTAFGQLLMALGRKASLRDPISDSFAALELTPAQVHSLMWLGVDGALTMGELARRLASTEKTITGVVDRMEREGLAKRDRDDKDRRVVHVALTKKGTQMHQKMQLEMRAKLDFLMSLLDPVERKSLIKILEKLVDRLGPTPPIDSPTKETR
jgi:DNA-binding MarR family transcriptional regulator